MTFRRSLGATGLALALAAGVAQAQEPTPGQPGAGRGTPRRELRAERGQGPLFRGITLTQAQQEQVRAINRKYAEEAQSLRQAARPAMEEVRAARQRGDTVAVRQGLARAADHRSRMFALHVRRVGELRRVLTPEQQRQFDANRAEMRQRADRRREEMREGGKRGGRRGAMRGAWRGQA